MSIALDSQCLMCHLRRNLEVVRPLGTEEKTMEFIREVLRLYLEGPTDVPSTWFNPQVSDLLQTHDGLPEDRMRQEKQDANRFVLERLDVMREKGRSAAEAL